jgi:stage II sporulation protein D
MLAREDIATSLGERYERFASLAPVDRVEVREATPAGRPIILAVVDADGREELLPVEAFRLTMDATGRRIRSSFFAIDNAPEGVALIAGRGYGHGVGLCQNGADAMARQGATAARILRHYYPGSRPRRAY